VKRATSWKKTLESRTRQKGWDQCGSTPSACQDAKDFSPGREVGRPGRDID
jgi:hypothetical protein